MIHIVFETHSTSRDNEHGVATGWLPGELSDEGREQAAELGRRRRDDGFAAVFASDLLRALQTAQVAFAEGGPPLFLDWRLRECDYGDLNGAPAAQVHGQRLDRLDSPYPNGESWRQATDRTDRFLSEAAGGVLEGELFVGEAEVHAVVSLKSDAGRRRVATYQSHAHRRPANLVRAGLAGARRR